jgi:hypothetical protein
LPGDAPSNLRIGFTGHRRHRLKASDRILTLRLLEAIELIRRSAKLRSAGQIEMVSALAEGADELAARAALKAGCRLTALLPFEPADYETTFADKAYKPVFRALMRKAERRIVLPGTLDDANAGYAAVGAETLDQSDIVLTVWDGAPAQGRGGTPEILQSALERRLRIVWVDAMEDRAPRLLERKAFGPCPRLENVARRAPAVNLRNISGHRRA